MPIHAAQQPSGCCLTLIVISSISIFFTLLLGAVHLEDRRIQRERLARGGATGGTPLHHLPPPVDVSRARHFISDWSLPGVLSRHVKYFGTYRFVPPACPPNTTLFVWVHSAADHFHQRQLVRDTWADMEYFRGELGAGVAYAFGVAQPQNISENSKLQRMLREEFEQHRDTVELGFVDSYYNVTYKAIGGLWYAAHRCPGRSLFLKLDDDTFVVRSRLVRFLRLLLRPDGSGRLNTTFSRTMMALFSPTAWTAPTRDKWMRNYIGEEEWPLSKFANHGAPGLAYFITGDLLDDLLRVANEVRWIWLEDVFILGILREELLRKGQMVRMLSLAPNVVHLYSNVKNKQRGIYQDRQKVFVGDHPAKKWMESFHYFESHG